MSDGASIAEALRSAAAALTPTSDTPRLDAEWLMAAALGVTRSDLLLRHLRGPAPASFAGMMERRRACEPMAYILGEQDFFGLTLRVTSDVLIPRGDSEVLVTAALASWPGARSVLDCGTGSGALLLAVLAHLPDARGVGVDCSAAALAVAADNAERLGLAPRARIVAADWREQGWARDLGAPFDLILANPPYVEDDALLARDVRDHEPAGALFAGPEGLDDYRLLIPQLPRLLALGGIAVVEIGHAQAAAVSALAEAAGLAACLHRDLADRPRVLQLCRKEGFSAP